MQIKVTGRGLEITAPLRDYVHGKVSKLEEFFTNIQKTEVVLDVRSTDNVERRQVAEIRVWLAGLKTIQASAAGRDMYAAIDLALAETERQIKQHKEKLIHEQRRKASKIKTEISENSQWQTEGQGPVLVKVSSFAAKPMDYEEAKAELKVLGQDFLAFRNAANDEVNVVRKNAEDYELLRPEKELTADEAIEELNVSGNNLIIFNDKSNQIPAIIFLRKSGNYGLIEPEL